MKSIRLIPVIFLAIALLASCSQGNKKQTSENKEVKKEVKQPEQAAPNTLTAEEKADGWKLLFDGTTTNGWRGYGIETFPEKGRVVEGGTLHVLGSGKGEAGGGGDIITDKKYGNFELSLEWKVSEGANSGIFYLAQEKPGQAIWKSSPEMQILDNDKHPDAKLGKDGNRAAGSLYDLIPGNFEAVNPAGQWNQVKILIYKGTVVHWVNGENVLEYHLWTDDWTNMVKNSKFKDYPDFVNPASEGYIGLQDHGDDVWFRNIKIKEL